MKLHINIFNLISYYQLSVKCQLLWFVNVIPCMQENLLLYTKFAPILNGLFFLKGRTFTPLPKYKKNVHFIPPVRQHYLFRIWAVSAANIISCSKHSRNSVFRPISTYFRIISVAVLIRVISYNMYLQWNPSIQAEEM